MILKAELLLDVDSSMVDSEVIAVLLEQVFKDNSHLAKMIVCEVKEYIEQHKRQHKWELNWHGTFCRNCGAQIGDGGECR